MIKLFGWNTVSQTRFSPRLKCKSELVQLKETCSDSSY